MRYPRRVPSFAMFAIVGVSFGDILWKILRQCSQTPDEIKANVMCKRRWSNSSASSGGRALKKLVEFGWCIVTSSARESVDFVERSEACLFVGRMAHLYKFSFRSKGRSSDGSSPEAGTARHRVLLNSVSTLESCQN